MHLCPDCLDYCQCHRDTDFTMHAAPADCRHVCAAEPVADEDEHQRWPWEGEGAC